MNSLSEHGDEFIFDNSGLRLWEQRHYFISQILIENKYTRVCDMGCNDGRFVKRLTNDLSFSLLVGVDIDMNSLEKAKTRLEPDAGHYLFKKDRKKILEVKLIKSDILFPFQLLKELKFDVITAIEVIEHLFKKDLPHFENNVFGFLQPNCVIITTPNFEFNSFFFKQFDDKIKYRHYDHKFEFTRTEFKIWCFSICDLYNYDVEITGIGLPQNKDDSKGFCTQIAIFKKKNFLEFQMNKILSLNYNNGNFENISSYEYCSWVYPYNDSCENIKNKIIEEIKYGYNFLKYYGKLQKHEFNENGFISIERICSLNKIDKILNENKKKIFEILTIFDLEKENIVLNSKKTHLKINYKYIKPVKLC